MNNTTTSFGANITLPMGRIAALCEKYQVEELSVFGSVLRDDFGPESDIDFLVVFQDGDAGPWMSRLLDLEEDLSALLGRKIDFVDKGGLEQSHNRPTRRRAILDTAQVIYPVEDGSDAAPGNADRAQSHQGPTLSEIPPLVPARIRFDPGRLAEFCCRRHIARLSLFGSVIRDDFSPDSDVDVLVEFEPGKTPGLRFITIQDDLTQLFGRRVDLNTPESFSVYLRDKVEAEVVPLYVQP
ncbi:MAG: nucleotidyltransferase family protein [Isosphaerales bacterium]